MSPVGLANTRISTGYPQKSPRSLLPTKLTMFSDSAIDVVASATLARRRGFLGFDEN